MQYPKLREGSAMSYTGHMEKHIIPELGELRLGGIKKADVTNFENKLLEKGYSIQSSHNIIYFLITLMNFASD